VAIYINQLSSNHKGMKVVAALVLLAIGCQARSLEKRQGSTADRGILAALPIDITAQVANIQRQLSQITETLTRILPVGQLGKRSETDGNGAGTATGGGLPLIGNFVGMEQLQQQLSALQATLTGFLSQFTRVFSGLGGLLAEGGTPPAGGDQNGGLQGVPFLGQLTQQLQVLQQQLQSAMAQFTRALGGLASDTSAPTQTQGSGTEFPILGQLTNQLQALQQQLQTMMAQFTRALGGLESSDTPSTALSLPDFSQFQRLLNDLSLTLNQLLGSVTRIFGFGATGTGTGTH